MSGGLFVNALARELGDAGRRHAGPAARAPHRGLHPPLRHASRRCPAPRELLATLTEHGVPWAIATSGTERYAGLARELLGPPDGDADGDA